MSKERLFERIKQFANANEYIYLLDKQRTCVFVDDLIAFMFPTQTRVEKKSHELDVEWQQLFERLYAILLSLQYSKNKEKVLQDTTLFFDKLDFTHNQLMDDANALFAFDPAAKSRAEIILAYPGFYAVIVYRLSHLLYQLQVPLLPRFISSYAHSRTGIDIHPGANIGGSFAIDHGTGVVIGETCVIGNGVKIYQGVTLGALEVNKNDAYTKRHPTIEDNVIIYAGATILGGNTVVGAHSIIGGNVWLLKSVAPYSVVYSRSEINVSEQGTNLKPIHFII